MRWLVGRPGLALTVALAGVAFAPLARAASAPPIQRSIAVATAPENSVPDAGEGEDGLEAREALGLAAPPAPAAVPQSTTADPAPRDAVAVRPDTLDAQFAALKAGAASPPPATLAALSEAPAVPPAVEAATAPPGPSVALARRVVESAQAFTDYMRRAGALRPDYADAEGVARALRAGGVYEPAQLEEGAIAYVALAALQDAAFVEGVNRLAGDEGGRAALAAQLAADPRRTLGLAGADEAASHAAFALARYGVTLQGAGAAVKQSAYDIQHAAWSKAAVSAPDVMLAELKARSAAREGLSDEGGRVLLASLGALRGPQTLAGSGRLTPSVAKGLTLAALAVLGQGGEDQAERVAALLADEASAQCLKMARLNLYQCLSVAGPQYEDVFCLGQHAMMETARCVSAASGWSPAATAVETPAGPAARPASIMVPVAMAVPAEDGAPAPASAPRSVAAPSGEPLQVADGGWR